MVSADPSLTSSAASDIIHPGEKSFFGHPFGLVILFFTEMWERFSYYGMRALLVLYMSKFLHFSDSRSSQIYGWYTGFCYLTPIFGGLLADRKLGYRKTILIGGSLMMLGHFLMAAPQLPFFFAALILLILGNGAFKPNISTIVGKLYKPGDHRRDRGFSIFYIGINLGAFFSPLVCGTLGEKLGYHVGFAAAGVGMAIGLCVFYFGQRYLSHVNMGRPDPADVKVAAQAKPEEKSAERGRLIALFVVCFFTIFFWAAYEQSGNTLTFWADRNTDRMIAGHEIPASWFQSINPLFIFVFAPVISALWSFLDRRKLEPSSPTKMAIGMFLLASSFSVMVMAAKAAGSDHGVVSSGWLVGSYFLATMGELCLSPIGLSLVTKVAPARLGGMLMGVWLLTSFFGNTLAGLLGQLWGDVSHTSFFTIFVVSSLITAVAMALMLPKLHKMMGGREA